MEGGGFVRGVLESDLRHIHFIVLKEILPNFIPSVIDLFFKTARFCFAFLL